MSDEAMYAAFVEKREKDVMATLFRKYMALVFGVCLKYSAGKEEAQDNTMEIFERLIQHQPNAEVRNFRGFLYVVSKNHCLMKQRGEKAMFITVSDMDVESAIELHPIDKENDEATLQTMEGCLKTLKALQKDCIELFYLKKQSYLEISKALKVTLNAVKSHIQNGKRNLKTCMEEQG
jgi:RNA polymerase sigma-70 factor (ECF subfamily)